MAQRFTGTILTDNGKKLDGARVVLKLNGTIIQKTITDKNGTFNITTSNDIDPSGATIIISKENYILYSISNPQPTGLYIPPRTLINPIYGGSINLNNSFDAGKYLISSLKSKDQEILYWELFNIQEFIKENPDNYEIVIVASESKVPNYDREEFLADGVTPNPNWAGPTNTFKTPELSAKTLSEKRYNSLKTYIENFFKEKSSTPPSVKSNIIVSGPDYKSGVDDINNFKQYQYVRLEARLITANCKTQQISDQSKSIDLPLIKPPGATRIILDAKEYPDRFGINKKLNNFYTLNASTPGGVEAWGFIVYLNLLLFGEYTLKNDTDLIKTKININTVRTALQKDSIVNREIRAQLLGFIYYFEGRLKGQETAESIRKSLLNDPIETIITRIFELIDTTNMYVISIKKENTIIRLDNIGDNESFILSINAGNIVEQSVFDFKICNDAQ